MIKIPSFLKKGDTVAIVCTARKFSPEEAQPAVNLLESWGLNVKLGSTIGLDEHQLGGKDDERAADFQTQLDDPNVKAIWCARGGYGTVRMIDKIDFCNFVKNPKWVMGFSDVTTLHSHIHNLGVATMHSIMAFSVPITEQSSIDSFKKAIFGESLNYTIPENTSNKPGTATGQLIGGNLSILYSLLGSPSAVNCSGKILFIEDLDEYLYHIDRILMNLKRNGCFKELKGLIVGGMTDMHDNTIPYGMDATQIIRDITAEYQFPICFDFPAGHQKNNQTILLGKEVTLSVNDNKAFVTYK